MYLFRRRDSASVLVLCIFILASFSIMAVGLYRAVSSQWMLTRAVQQRITARYLADSACVYFNALSGKDLTPHDTLYELSSKVDRELASGKFSYTLSDEESRININTASEDALAMIPGISQELAGKISSSLLKPFYAPEELMYVEGFDENAYLACKDFITVYSSGKVNINTASIEVLKAAGIPDGVASRIERFRTGPDAKSATEDDVAFRDLSELFTFTILSVSEQEALVEAVPGLSVNSDNFCLHIDTVVMEKSALKYDIVISQGKIKRWIEL